MRKLSKVGARLDPSKLLKTLMVSETGERVTLVAVSQLLWSSPKLSHCSRLDMVKVLLLWHKLKSTTLRFILTMPKEVTMEDTKQTHQEVVAKTPPEAKVELPHAVMEVEEQLEV